MQQCLWYDFKMIRKWGTSVSILEVFWTDMKSNGNILAFQIHSLLLWALWNLFCTDPQIVVSVISAWCYMLDSLDEDLICCFHNILLPIIIQSIRYTIQQKMWFNNILLRMSFYRNKSFLIYLYQNLLRWINFLHIGC